MATQDTITTPPATARRHAPDFTDQFIEPFSQLRSEVDRLLDSLPFRMPSLRLGRAAAAMTVPALEMTETDKAYKITAELPGIDPGEVEVTFEDGLLRIAGEKKEEREENERGYRLSERSYGRFERCIELPAAAEDDGIKAGFRDGVLTVTVPKALEARHEPRRIAVEKA
jgi:HSP20 family protein